MHGALRKAQLEFPPETLLKKWRERRIIDGKRPALRRDDFRTKTASRRMLLGRSRRRNKTRTEQNHFALQSPRHPRKVRRVCGIDECVCAVARNPRIRNEHFAQIFARHAFERIPAENLDRSKLCRRRSRRRFQRSGSAARDRSGGRRRKFNRPRAQNQPRRRAFLEI